MSSSLYRFLLHLYPASFRAEYGDELLRAFAEAARHRGPVANAVAALRDIVPNALIAHGSMLRQDLHYAFRTMRRSRVFVATVILVTALGVGANTATFSVADLVLLRPLPFRDPGALVRLCEGPREGGGWGCMNELSPANYRDVARTTTTVRQWGVYTGAEGNLVGTGEPVRVGAEAVSPEVFPILGVRPLLGRVFDTTAAGQRDAGSVVLSYGLWQSQFGGRSGILGTTIRLDDKPRTIIGVMPPAFRFPAPGTQLWTPLVLRDTDFVDRTNTYLQGIGRLEPGVTFDQARAELALVFGRLSRENPETNRDTWFSFFRLHDEMAPRYRLMLLLLCGASLSLLLLTGANLANLLLARATARELELAVRAALGAGRERLVRQMLTESLVLAIIGGLIGVAVATLAVPLLAHLIPTSLPLGEAPRLDSRALLVAGAFTALTGFVFGLIPALVTGRRTAFRALREGARGGGGRRQRLRTTLVAIEVAVSVLLLVSSTFLARAVWRVQSVDPGFSSDGVLTLRTTLTQTRAADSVRRTEFYDRVLAGVRALPGVTAAAYTSGLPMVLTGGITGVELPGQPARNRRANGVSLRFVTPQFFDVLKIPILAGRRIEEADRLGRPLVAVVSESFVARQLSNEPPIGKTFRARGLEYTIVGVVKDIKVRGLERTNEPQLYLSAAQGPGALGILYIPKDLIIRAGAGSAGLVAAARDIIHRIDAQQPVSDVRMLSNVVEGQTADRRAQLRILIALAGLALLLTAIGIYGLLAFMVTQRAREIGVRLALGAEPGRVARMVVGDATRLALIGGVPGVIAAYAVARAMNALLFGIAPTDPVTLASGFVIVLLATIAGSLAPAMSAVRVSPLVAMRAE
ncbi:MAG TPA: ABC transporter permease [Gemmatimonadaceae bacterium]|jgi:putative ABC transport system permease protein|nr:ABC transporter permease [Gemmatimonadaceae bacterium]